MGMLSYLCSISIMLTPMIGFLDQIHEDVYMYIAHPCVYSTYPVYLKLERSSSEDLDVLSLCNVSTHLFNSDIKILRRDRPRLI